MRKSGYTSNKDHTSGEYVESDGNDAHQDHPTMPFNNVNYYSEINNYKDYKYTSLRQ